MPINNEIFATLPVESFKKIAIETLKDVEIIIYKPQRKIDNPTDIDNIIHDYHVAPKGGHVGQNRLYEKLKDIYYWKNMKKTIIRFVKSCKSCKTNEVYRRTKEPNIVTTTPAKPFDVISIDTVPSITEDKQ